MRFRRGGALRRLVPSLGGLLARVVAGWLQGRARTGHGAMDMVVCLPDAASHTSWAVRGIKTRRDRTGAPYDHRPLN
jgi:hypothetical protein